MIRFNDEVSLHCYRAVAAHHPSRPQATSLAQTSRAPVVTAHDPMTETRAALRPHTPRARTQVPSTRLAYLQVARNIPTHDLFH